MYVTHFLFLLDRNMSRPARPKMQKQITHVFLLLIPKTHNPRYKYEASIYCMFSCIQAFLIPPNPNLVMNLLTDLNLHLSILFCRHIVYRASFSQFKVTNKQSKAQKLIFYYFFLLKKVGCKEGKKKSLKNQQRENRKKSLKKRESRWLYTIINSFLQEIDFVF